MHQQWRLNKFEGGGEHRSGATVGGTYLARSLEKNLVVPLHFFGSKSTISSFGERFCDGQYSLVSFLFAVFFYSRCPRVPTFVKVGARAPVPYECRHHCTQNTYMVHRYIAAQA